MKTSFPPGYALALVGVRKQKEKEEKEKGEREKTDTEKTRQDKEVNYEGRTTHIPWNTVETKDHTQG